MKVANYGLSEALDDYGMPEHCLVVSFPARHSIFELFAGPEYQALIKLRDLGFKSVRYFIGSENIDQNSESENQ